MTEPTAVRKTAIKQYINDYISSNLSLLHYCELHNIKYSTMYYHVKKLYPDCISRTNNGKTEKSRVAHNEQSKLNITSDELYKLFYVDGFGQREIAELYGVSKSLISMKMKKYGFNVKIVGQSRYWTEVRKNHFRMLANSGTIGVFRQHDWKYHTTSIERFFMDECTKLNILFKRKMPIQKYGHLYDFYIPKFNLLVEMDGEYFHSIPKQKIKDIEQMRIAENLGYNIIRITDVQIRNNKNIVVEILNGFN